MSIESHLIEHCAPTLASLKTGSLFSLCVPDWTALWAEIRRVNTLLTQKGLTLRAVRVDRTRALVYLVRRSQLDALLRDGAAADFLRAQGYSTLDVPGTITTLLARLAGGGDFPHEIGLFLGYPLADVIGFIHNKGRNALCCGYWKAYANEREALRTFARYDKCKLIYRRAFTLNPNLERLVVTA